MHDTTRIRNLHLDLMHELAQTKWIESEKAGRDVGWLFTAYLFKKYYWAGYIRKRRWQHISGEVCWPALDKGDFGELAHPEYKTEAIDFVRRCTFLSWENLDFCRFFGENQIAKRDIMTVLDVFDINWIRSFEFDKMCPDEYKIHPALDQKV